MSYKDTVNYFVKNILRDYDEYHQFSNDELASHVFEEVVGKVPDASLCFIGSYQYICLTRSAYEELTVKIENLVSQKLREVDEYQAFLNKVNPFGG